MQRVLHSLLPALNQQGSLLNLSRASVPALLRAQSQWAGDRQLALTQQGKKAGPGGRNSVSGMTATIFGANGFVGSYVTNEIARKGSQVVLPHRTNENEIQHLKQMGDLGQVVLLSDFSIRDEEMIKYTISRSNVVINLIGQRLETMNYTFDDVHVKWPERLAKICAASPNVERLIHFSELGADVRHPSRRMSSKAKGDRLVQEIMPSATIVRPGPIVGVEDYFFNQMVYQLSFGLAATLIDDGAARLQPTWIRDVADAVQVMLKVDESRGKIVNLAGPETLTVRGVYDLMIETLRLHQDDTIHIPKSVAGMFLKPLDAIRRHLPNMPMDSHFNSADYMEETTRDAVAPKGSFGYEQLGMKANKVTEGLPLEPVRHFRKGGYRWGDMQQVAKHVPDAIKSYYNIK